MGVVYEAVDKERDHHVALKTIREMTGGSLVRLKNEFRALQDLHHPNLVALHELVEDAGRWFIIMELVEGVSFLQYVRPHPLATSTANSAGPAAGVSPSAATWRPTPAQAAWDATAENRRFDEARLRQGLRQVVAGLKALHDAGKVHRDVKPANILVTGEDRVVLLDLGLVTGIRESDQSTAMHAVGTAGYMAPEQAASQRATPAADWYSIGVVLFQALTGQLPFSGNDLRVMIDKQHVAAPAPRELNEDVPADLNDLCGELLRFIPEARPGGDEILSRLGMTISAEISPPSMPSTFTQTPPFVGRERELAALHNAFAASRERGAVVAMVDGESGVGKTALVDRFTDDLAANGTVVLAGRCYERESVPYKGIDGVIDSLGRYLARLDDKEVAALLPREAALLARVFPVLRRVKEVATAPVLQVSDKVDPQEMRARLFAAVRELITRLADRRALVLVIDDLQWAAADSLALLSEILRPPEAPRLLAVTIIRSGSSLGSTAPRELERSLPLDLHRVSVGRLSEEESRDLTTRLLRGASAPRCWDAARIAVEARGHPLFIDELVRHVMVHDGEVTGRLRLDDALRRRVADLPAPARLALELVAVAGRPLSQGVVAAASGLESSDLASALGVLRVSRLAQARGSRRTDLVGVYHDRVRESVVASLPHKRKQQRHRDLALALEGAGSDDPEALATHWREAGEPERAVVHALQAAAEAERAFTFDRAAHLYRMLLELAGSNREKARELRVKHANALANAGRGAEAAAAYQDAAERSSSVVALELRRRAAEQLLRSGHVDRGLQVVQSVLQEIGLSLPKTPLRAMAAFLWRRTLIRLRGLHFRLRDAGEVSSVARLRVEICFSLSHALSMVDTVRGADFQARGFLMALRLGDPHLLVIALAVESSYASLPGRPAIPRAARLVQLQEKVARHVDTPIGYAWGRSGEAMVAYYAGRFRRAREASGAAEAIFREECVGMTWELGICRLFHCWCLWYLGDLAEMSRRVRRQEAEALDRGDLYSVTNFRLGPLNTAWLQEDRVDEARQVADDAYSLCSRVAASTQQWYYMTSLVQTLLYTGEGEVAHQEVLRRWADISRSYLLRVQLVRVEAWHLRGRAGLAAVRNGDGLARDDPRLHDTQRAIRRIRRERMHWALPLADLLAAGLEATLGHTAAAVDRASRALRGFEEADMALYAAAARSRLGRLLEGTAGEHHTRRAEAFFQEAHVRRPEAWVAMLAPGF